MKDNPAQQQSMDHDFLDGIDEQFQRLMKASANGKRNGRSSRSYDSITQEIIDLLQGLTTAQKENVLTLVRSLKHQAE